MTCICSASRLARANCSPRTRCPMSSRRPIAKPWSIWLRHRPLAHHEHGHLLVHAGVLPQWSLEQTLALAGEVEARLRGPDWKRFLRDLLRRQEPDALGRPAVRDRTRARHRQRADPHPLVRRPWRDGTEEHVRARASAGRAHALVRRSRPSHRRHHHRLRSLVHARAETRAASGRSRLRAASGAAS